MKRGRPKGYTPYIEMTQKQLSQWIGKKTKIPVSRKWLEFIIGEEISSFVSDNQLEDDYTEESPSEVNSNDTIKNESEQKIEYTLTKF